MILADASIWIAMFRTRVSKAERSTLTLAFFDRLIQLRPLRPADVRHVIETRGLVFFC